MDIKMLYFFLDNALERFYKGVSPIIGNGDLDLVNMNTLSLLQLNHYKVYLISTLYEKLLDLFDLVFFKVEENFARGKWEKKFKKLSTLDSFSFISSEEQDFMLRFKAKVRTAEIHGFSSVFRQLYKNEWVHFSQEETIVKTITQRIYESCVVNK